MRSLLALTLLLASPAIAQTAPPAPPSDLGPDAPQIPPPCRRVGDVASIRFDPAKAVLLAEIGLDRAAIFQRMQETSIPETTGCWAMPAGNFDSQLISVGMAQWNYGTGSLQPVLTAWRDGFGRKRDYKAALKAMAPVWGKSLMSKDCLAVPMTPKCRETIAAGEDARGALTPGLQAELTAIFESDAMLQVQADFYVELLLKVRDDLRRVFPGRAISPRMVKWAIDTRVQQGYLPGDEDLARLRTKLAAMPEADRWPRLRAIVDWYGALARTIDQDGISRDAAWNVAAWGCMIDTGRIDAEQYELLSITFLRSRTAVGNSGRWQALTFERRAKIILGVGSVSGVRDGECQSGAERPVK